MRIMLDTNILISIIIFNSNKLKDMLVNICNKHTLVLSPYIIEELQDVINRKFPEKRNSLEKFLFRLPYELEYTPTAIKNEDVITLRDPKDIPVLFSAIISDVDILITGDKDFDNLNIERPEIMTVAKFIEKYM